MGTGIESFSGFEQRQAGQLQYSDVVQSSSQRLDFGKHSNNAAALTVDSVFGKSSDLLAADDGQIADAPNKRPTVSDAARQIGGKVLSQPDAKGQVMEWENTQAKAKGHDREHPYVEGSQVLPGPPAYRTEQYAYFTDEHGQAVCQHWHNNGGNGQPDYFVRVSSTTALKLPNGDRCNAVVRADLNGNPLGVDLSVVRPTVPPSGYSVENVPPSKVEQVLKKINEMETPKYEDPKNYG